MHHTITLNLIVYLKKRDALLFFLIFTRALEHVVCLGESRLSQVNNSPGANVFQAGVANFGKAIYRSLERSTQETRDGLFLYSAQTSIIFLAVR